MTSAIFNRTLLMVHCFVYTFIVYCSGKTGIQVKIWIVGVYICMVDDA